MTSPSNRESPSSREIKSCRSPYQDLANASPDRERPRLRGRHAGEVRQSRDHAVGQLDMPFDPAEVLGLLLGRGVARGEQEVNRGLDHVQGVAQFMGNARGNLPQTGQTLDLLLAAK